jgi:DNA-binding XRE family transcriptional regulator
VPPKRQERPSTHTFIPSAIRAARGWAGLTTTDLAAKVGVTRQTLTSWEAGDTTPPAETFDLILSVCGVPVFWR